MEISADNLYGGSSVSSRGCSVSPVTPVAMVLVGEMIAINISATLLLMMEIAAPECINTAK